MRNVTLHGLLEAFTTDASARLSLAAADGDEIPFEVVESERRARGAGAGRAPLYCYRPLTGAFIRARLGLLVALPTYAPAARALEPVGGTEAYLRARGESRVSDRPRERADAALRCFLARVFEERSEFGFDDERFAAAYEELERTLYQGQSVIEVIAPILGLEIDPETTELLIGDGISIVRRDAVAELPAEAIWDSATSEDPTLVGPAGVLIVLRLAQDRIERTPVWLARTRFRRVLTALRLFERGGYAIGPIGWTRVDTGVWRPVAVGTSARTHQTTTIAAGQEDEFRAFCSLIGRRLPAPGTESSGAGEVAWALSRYEMGCEKVGALEALTDYLLALRALLEPEGPGSGRLAQRLAVICARRDDRAGLAERTAHAISLERAVIAGLAPTEPGAERLVDELSEHLRAILRDILCGHLAADVRRVADDLLAEAATASA